MTGPCFHTVMLPSSPLSHRLRLTRRAAINMCGALLLGILPALPPLPAYGGSAGKLLLEEDFSQAALPANWRPGGRANSFKVVDGALQGTCAKDDHHGPAITVPLTGHDLKVQFSVKFSTPAYFLFLIDGESQFGGQAHLLRLAAGKNFAQFAQDRGTLKSKQEQAVMKREAQQSGKKITPPTKEQLADPKFYRTESLDRKPAKVDDGQWHEIVIDLHGNDATATIDGKPSLKAHATVWDVKKSEIVFLVGLGGTVQVDKVKVWETGASK